MPESLPVYVSQKSFDSEAPSDIVRSNHSVVHVLVAEGCEVSRLSLEARWSSAVFAYDSEVKNGGFPQFVFNSKWAPTRIKAVEEGLEALRAGEHLALFRRAAAIVNALPAATL